MTRALRIAQVAPPMERVPPRAYGGTERIVHELARELDRRGHEVTTFASGDSEVPGRLIPTVPHALRPAGYDGDAAPWFYLTIQAVLDRAAEFDVIHSHLEWASSLLSRVSPVPVVATFHGRIDLPWAAQTLANARGALVAISANQASTNPDVPWAGVVHNGLTLDGAPFERRRGEDLCFVGRVAPEKGIIEAIDIARATGRTLRIAAKSGPTPAERDYLENVFQPALRGRRHRPSSTSARSSRPSATSCLPGPTRRSCRARGRSHSGSSRSRPWPDRHARHRPARRRLARDHPRRHRRVLRRRRRASWPTTSAGSRRSTGRRSVNLSWSGSRRRT